MNGEYNVKGWIVRLVAVLVRGGGGGGGDVNRPVAAHVENLQGTKYLCGGDVAWQRTTSTN